ncbi:UNVERIFIED_CONTAM: hypothetical protein HDU68_009214 [Siphonaria sp. JEL0065]|nr:hypothetical protein HDU68_009214 [Siphonaria sp. JEL0065]
MAKTLYAFDKKWRVYVVLLLAGLSLYVLNLHNQKQKRVSGIGGAIYTPPPNDSHSLEDVDSAQIEVEANVISSSDPPSKPVIPQPVTPEPPRTFREFVPPLKECTAEDQNGIPSEFAQTYGCVCIEGQTCQMVWDKLQLRGDVMTGVAGVVNRLTVQFLSDTGLPVFFASKESKKDEELPAIVITVEAFDMSERLYVLPSSNQHATFEFEFELYTTNVFQVAVWVEGDKMLWKHNDPEAMLSRNGAYSLEKISTHNLTISANPTTPQDSLLQNQYNQRPRCSGKHIHNLAGRWLDPRILPQDIRKHNIPSPLSEGRGAKMVFLPNSCRINYYTDMEAMKCLTNKKILIIGDSTSNEIGFDMAMHLFLNMDDHWPRYFTRESNEWPVNNPLIAGGDTETAPGCDQWMLQRQYYWPVTVLGMRTEISKAWSGQTNPCTNGGGSSSINDPKYLEKLTRAEYDPAQLANFTFPGDPKASEKAPLPSVEDTIKTGRPSDLVMYNTLLHDFLTGMSMEYGSQVGQILKGLKPGAKTGLYMLSNPKLPNANVAIRHFNEIIKNVAPENGFLAYDAHSIQLGRLSSFEQTLIYGDIHHGTTWRETDAHNWERTPFTHVPVQVLLNVICSAKE